MAKATEAKLGNLHGIVADVLASQVAEEEDITTFDNEGNLVPTGETRFCATPATIAAAIKFLKDNDITADQTTNANLGNLAETLAKKQRHSRLKDPKSAAKLHAV